MRRAYGVDVEPRTENLIRTWLLEAASPLQAPLSRQAERFLTDVLVEAFSFRTHEPFAQGVLGLSPFQASEYGEVEAALHGPVGESARKLLEASADVALSVVTGSNEILVADLLVVINRRWCGVWPFCRADA
jgi:hypothetical protein